MAVLIKRAYFLILIIVVEAMGLPFSFSECANFAETYAKVKIPPTGWWAYQKYRYQDIGECGHFVMRCLEQGFNGPFIPHKKKNFWWRLKKLLGLGGCSYDDGTPTLDDVLRNWQQLGLNRARWVGSMPNNIGEIRNALGNRTPHIFVWRYLWFLKHAGVFISDSKYAAHSKDGTFNFFPLHGSITELLVFNFPGEFNECRGPKTHYGSDSDAVNIWSIRHQWVCCWHERLDGEPPWASNPTPYMCLKWDETNGTTWDTLISPRINLAGCSAIVFIQSCTTNLIRGSNKTIEIRGSTNDGATWTYCIGTDTTTRIQLPWASNQRNVRIAWIYKGPVQAGRFWCIDDVGIWAKPTREHDICVSEVRNPKGRVV